MGRPKGSKNKKKEVNSGFSILEESEDLEVVGTTIEREEKSSISRETALNVVVGHVKNLLPFLGGSNPIWQQRRTYVRHNVKRGIHLG